MKRRSLLLITALIFLLGAAGLFAARYLFTEDHRAVNLSDIQDLRAVTGDYRSINNWATVETTTFLGIPLYRFLQEYGITDGDAQIKLIAPDGYFWPAVDTTLTVDQLKQANTAELYPLLAWEMNGAALEPEPSGSGPLRLVMPQYSETDVNKPSWVSNVRLIEVGPLKPGAGPPDAAAVPVDQVWLYGSIASIYVVPVWGPFLLLIAAGLLLAEYLFYRLAASRIGPNGSTSLLLVLLLTAAVMAAPLTTERARATPAPVVFSGVQLAGMPQTSGHYTFLKSQEPYTYYEADYSGVALSYLLGSELALDPGASEVVVKARDGYNVTLSLSEARRSYPGGLRAIIATAKGGTPLSGDEGKLRLIVPQSTPGTRDQGGEPNTPLCARMIYAIEVRPLPASVTAVSPGEVPDGSLAVYGAVSVPAPPVEPQPEPEPTPAQPGTTQPATTPPATTPAPTSEPFLVRIDPGILSSPLCRLVYGWLSLVKAPSIFLDPVAQCLWYLEGLR